MHGTGDFNGAVAHSLVTVFRERMAHTRTWLLASEVDEVVSRQVGAQPTGTLGSPCGEGARVVARGWTSGSHSCHICQAGVGPR